MKTIALGLCVVIICYGRISGQSNDATDQVIEGGKVVVELIKVLSGKRDPEKNQGCKGTYADFCVMNESSNSITVVLNHLVSKEKRELIILPAMKECCLQIAAGVWNYDLKMTAGTQSIRKGDLLIEGCQNLNMNIK